MTTAQEDPIVVVGMARTAMGSFQGVLAPLTAPQLGSAAIKGAIERAGMKPEEVSEVLMGCVLPAGHWPGAGTAGIHRRRRAQHGALHDSQQDVRLGHEDGDAGL